MWPVPRSGGFRNAKSAGRGDCGAEAEYDDVTAAAAANSGHIKCCKLHSSNRLLFPFVILTIRFGIHNSTLSTYTIPVPPNYLYHYGST